MGEFTWGWGMCVFCFNRKAEVEQEWGEVLLWSEKAPHMQQGNQ